MLCHLGCLPFGFTPFEMVTDQDSLGNATNQTVLTRVGIFFNGHPNAHPSLIGALIKS